MLMCGVKITVCESHDAVPHLDYKKQHEEWCTKRQIQSYSMKKNLVSFWTGFFFPPFPQDGDLVQYFLCEWKKQIKKKGKVE